jgi:hypothetical protein
MAQGDLVLFEETIEEYSESINFETDTFKMSLVVAATTPTAADAGPAYSGGTTNYGGANESTAGGNYTAGGATLANPAFSEAAGVVTFDADDPASWAQDASNPTDARWAVIYDDTTTPKHAIAFVDLGSTFDMTTGDLTITLASGGILQLEIQASV